VVDVVLCFSLRCVACQASDVLAKIDEYHSVFQEDFAGINGRSKKTLWLTEVRVTMAVTRKEPTCV
jgi:hypothetical protein